MSETPCVRVGQGYDAHRLVSGRPLVLGGETIPYERGLDGHSDADVLLHALGDALLGAAALGDLGEHFPPSDARWKDADSSELVRRIVAMVAESGWLAVSCDLVLVAEAPRLAPYRDRIRRRIAGLLSVPDSAVSVKATTNEGMGWIGRGEGMAALAVAVLTPSAAQDD